MSAPVIEITQGKLRGKVAKDYNGRNYHSFQGIPYAKPPIGDLRFKSPLPPDNWMEIRDATCEGNASLSRHMFHREQFIGAEDCLFLNVYTPKLPSNDGVPPLPVMFWIHGGGFVKGSGNPDTYGPDYLVSKDVVLVTINYRVGILGFLSLEDPTLDVPGNMGLKDVVQALKWVQGNIQKFGGDSTNVTIFGESAGGAASHLLILSPMAKDLFHRAIIQSGSAFNAWVFGARIPTDICKVLGYETNNEKDALKFLLSVPTERFMEAQNIIADSLGCAVVRPFSVVIEKPSTAQPGFLTEHPIDIIKSGNYNKVPIMIGYTNREGLITEGIHINEYGSLKMDAISDLQTRIPYYYNIEHGSDLKKNITKKIKKFYFNDKDVSTDNIDQFLKLESDVLFCHGIYVAMREHLKNLNLPIYFYRFSLESTLNLFKITKKLNRSGTAHLDDIGYLFKTDYLNKIIPGSFEEHAMLKMVSMWTNFAKKGDPNPIANNEDEWKETNSDTYDCLDIGKEFLFTKNPDLERMKFWDGIGLCAAIKPNF